MYSYIFICLFYWIFYWRIIHLLTFLWRIFPECLDWISACVCCPHLTARARKLDKYLSQISFGDELERRATSNNPKMSFQRKRVALERSSHRILFATEHKVNFAKLILNCTWILYRSEGFLSDGVLEGSLGLVSFPEICSGDLMIISWHISKFCLSFSWCYWHDISFIKPKSFTKQDNKVL